MRNLLYKTPLAALFMLLLVWMVVGCSKGATNTGEAEHRVETIKVSLPSSYTKVSISDGGTTFPLGWQSGDEITVIGSSVNTFSIVPGFSVSEAQFSGFSVSGYTFKVMHPGSITSITGFDEYDYSTQTQVTNGGTDHLRFVAALTGVKDYHEVTFSEEWASANGAVFQQSAILKIVAKLPAGATKANKIALSTSEPFFFTTNSKGSASTEFSINLNNLDPSDSGELAVFMEMSVQPVSIPAGTPITVSVDLLEGGCTQVYTLPSDLNISGGKVAELTIDDDSSWMNTGGRYLKGSGTESDPYLIGSAKQIRNMAEDVNVEKCTYFKLAEDIDMSDIENWTPLNTESGFKKQVFFDGDGHTIKNFKCNKGKYPSFFGVLYGTVQNITFDGVTLGDTDTGASIGTIGGFVGTSDIQATVRNVTIKNVSIRTMGLSSASGSGFGAVAGQTNGSGNVFENVKVEGFSIDESDNDNDLPRNVGGFIGYIRGDGTFSNCSVENVNIKGWICLGGFAGYERAGTHEYVNCLAKDVTISSSVNADRVAYVGGFCGAFNANGAILRQCHVKNFTFNDNVYCQEVGGLVGRAYGGVNEILGHGPKITECSVDGGSLGKSGIYVGGLIGRVSSNCIVEDCWAGIDVNPGNTQFVGGLIGAFDGSTVNERVVRRCLALGKVSGGSAIGGLIGLLQASNPATDTEHIVENCIAWNPSVVSSRVNDDVWSSGAIIGVAGNYNTLTNNVRRSDMVFTDSSETVYDQGDTNSSIKLDAGHYSLHYAYHGKAAGSADTASSIASALGWSTKIWDLSGSVPALK